MESVQFPVVGIDDISIYIPSLYLPISDLAEARGIEPDKLRLGLGLKTMSVPDASEDVVTMAAEALIDLVSKNDLAPEEIHRIYVGTESSVDASKPIASYLLGVLSRYYTRKGVESDALKQCDAVDMTFACIGTVDAMQNCLDWIRLNPQRKAIVVSTDWAKYDLDSPGEYTQGASAIAVLLSADPGLVEVGKDWGVSTECQHDFYKPLRREIESGDIEAPQGISRHLLGRDVVQRHSDTPIYDGRFSNTCYGERVDEAFRDFSSKKDSGYHPLDRWASLVFHLPYAYHARRVFTRTFVDELRKEGRWDEFAIQNAIDPGLGEGSNDKELLKAVSKSGEYKAFIDQKIAPGEIASSYIGNIYTGSIFLSLISALAYSEDDLAEQSVGMLAYGSGSKAKVFEGKVVRGYRQRIERINIQERLTQRRAVTFEQYELLHKKTLLCDLDSVNRVVFHTSSGWLPVNKYARHYSVR